MYLEKPHASGSQASKTINSHDILTSKKLPMAGSQLAKLTNCSLEQVVEDQGKLLCSTFQSGGDQLYRNLAIHNFKLNPMGYVFHNQMLKYTYMISEGNNSNLVRRVMQSRDSYWLEVADKQSNFRWQPTSSKYSFQNKDQCK